MYFTGKNKVAVEVAETSRNNAVEGYAKHFAEKEMDKIKGKKRRNKQTGQVEKYPVTERRKNGRE